MNLIKTKNSSQFIQLASRSTLLLGLTFSLMTLLFAQSSYCLEYEDLYCYSVPIQVRTAIAQNPGLLFMTNLKAVQFYPQIIKNCEGKQLSVQNVCHLKSSCILLDTTLKNTFRGKNSGEKAQIIEQKKASGTHFVELPADVHCPAVEKNGVPVCPTPEACKGADYHLGFPGTTVIDADADTLVRDALTPQGFTPSNVSSGQSESGSAKTEKKSNN